MPPLHRQLREELAARIDAREFEPGDRLPAERQLAGEHGVARSVVRQALAALARDGRIVSAYPRGYRVLGPRIPWLPRLRPLSDEPWDVEVIDVVQTTANARDAAELAIGVEHPVIVRPFTLRGARTHEPWALALATYPLHAFDEDAHPLLLGFGFVTDEELARAGGRRIVGHHERVRARSTTPAERETLRLDSPAIVLEVNRTAHTTTTPLCTLHVAALADRFEIDYRTDV
jgi:DNA-binding GntR family transcriptional regulator